MNRILIVEDDPNQLRRIGEIVQAAFPDDRVLLADTVEKAKKEIDQVGGVGLVATDYVLPDGTGYDVLEHCKDFPLLPVIIFTAYGRDEEKEVRPAKSLKLGAVDFMHKPIDFDEFIERVRRAIETYMALV